MHCGRWRCSRRGCGNAPPRRASSGSSCGDSGRRAARRKAKREVRTRISRAAGDRTGTGRTKNEPHRTVGLEKVERRGFLKPRRMYEVLTLPFAFPALGHDVKQVYRTHSRDLLAQKCELFVPWSMAM